MVSKLPQDALLPPSGLLGTVLGHPKSENVQTVLCENHFFESRSFGVLEPQLALLGLSGCLPSQSCCPGDPQKWSKSDPESGPKTGPNSEPLLSSSRTHFGAHFGVKNGGVRGTRFSNKNRDHHCGHHRRGVDNIEDIIAPPGWPRGLKIGLGWLKRAPR